MINSANVGINVFLSNLNGVKNYVFL